MDIALKFKRVAAIAASGALIASLFASFGFNNAYAQAQMYTDLSSADWGSMEIEQLAEMGIFESGAGFEEFRKDDNMLRAEVAAALNRAGDFLAGCPDAATQDSVFSDVPNTGDQSWPKEHFNCLEQFGVFTGDTDADGNRLFTVRPFDDISRIETLATLVRAFDIQAIPELGDAPFPDIEAGSWWEETAHTGWQNGIVQGDQGRLEASREVTRREFGVMLYRAMGLEGDVTPPPACDPETDPDCPQPPVPCDPEVEECPVTESDGVLNVVISPDNPGDQTAPKNAQNVNAFEMALTANGGDIQLTGVDVHRIGPGEASDFSGVYLFEGTQPLTVERTFSSDTQMATFTLKNYTIPDGETVYVSTVVNIDENALAGSEHDFFVNAEDFEHNGKDTTGDFQLDSNTLRIGSVTVSNVTVKEGPSISNALLGATETVGNMKITAGTNDIAIQSILFTQNGTYDSENLEACQLKRAEEVLAETELLDGDELLFDLTEEPYVIDQGQSRSLDIECKLAGGDPDETIILDIDEPVHFNAMDLEFGFGAKFVDEFDPNVVTTEGGVVTISDNGPSSQDLANSATDQSLLDFTAVVGEEMLVKDTIIQIDLRDPTSAGPSLPADTSGTVYTGLGGNDDTSGFCIGSAFTGTLTAGDALQVVAASGTVNLMAETVTPTDAVNCADGADADAINETYVETSLPAGDTVTNNQGTSELNPYTFIKNVEMVNNSDPDSPFTVIDPIDNASSNGSSLIDANGVVDGPTAPHSYQKKHPQDYDLVPGANDFQVRVDLDANTPANYQLRAQVFFGNPGDTNSFIKLVDSNTFVPLEDVIVSPVVGNFMTTAANTLTINRAGTPNSEDVVKGGMVETIGISMTAGDAGDVKVTDMKVRFYGCDNTDDGVGVGNTAGIQCFEDLTGADTGDSLSWENTLGNKAANTIISSVELWEDDAPLEGVGPVNITLVNLGGGAGYDAGTDYYEAEFNDLGLIIPSGDTRTIVPVADTLNTISDTVRFAADIVAASDIQAEELLEGNTVAATSTPDNLNGLAIKDPLITVNPGGTLSCTAEGSADGGLVLAGADEVPVARYRCDAIDETWRIEKLNIMQDLTGAFDTPAEVDAVQQVVIKFPDEDGVTQTTQKALVAPGQATFSNLDFYVKPGQPAYLEVFANLDTIEGGGSDISGNRVRLGLQNLNTPTTFKAIGQESDTIENFTQEGDLLNDTEPETHTVRRAIPMFSTNTVNTTLTNTNKNLFDLDIDVDGDTAVDVSRMIFNIDLGSSDADADNLDLHSFRLDKNDFEMNQADVNIINAADNLDLWTATAGTTTVHTNGVTSASFQVIVTFNQAESINGNVNYLLSATAHDVEADDTITVELADGDENVDVTQLTGQDFANANPNNNTGQLVGPDGGNEDSIFDTAGDYRNSVAADAGVDITSANIVWSDLSADTHVFSVANNSSSYDFTNGYKLKVNQLDEVIFVAP